MTFHLHRSQLLAERARSQQVQLLAPESLKYRSDRVSQQAHTLVRQQQPLRHVWQNYAQLRAEQSALTRTQQAMDPRCAQVDAMLQRKVYGDESS